MGDGLDRLWAPHRMEYIESDDTSEINDGACPFCTIPAMPDEDGLVVFRGTAAYAVLNRYPYNPGHLLVCTYRHVADYTELEPDEVDEVAMLTRRAMGVVRGVSAPHGFNIGINQGDVAGAGIAGHFHQHLVPRWGGDANFMPVVGQTKVLPQLLKETRRLLAESWRQD